LIEKLFQKWFSNGFKGLKNGFESQRKALNPITGPFISYTFWKIS